MVALAARFQAALPAALPAHGGVTPRKFQKYSFGPRGIRKYLHLMIQEFVFLALIRLGFHFPPPVANYENL